MLRVSGRKQIEMYFCNIFYKTQTILTIYIYIYICTSLFTKMVVKKRKRKK